MTWSIGFYDQSVEDGILGLASGFVARFLRYAERMQVFGADLGMPHTRAMGDGLFELRIKSAKGIARVFYCTGVGRRIVFLHHFVKKAEKTPTAELKMARKRMKELGHG
ncbi:MAG: type II toxin-antitoxin system RelE/ParE family toxin [Xanthomonadales bacterium]|nr:type II toxin-antitoxin system RelE/ParE family toxin [Xanthomonadales bacterium]